MNQSLEDFTEDVIRKAQKGLGVSDRELQEASGATAQVLEQCADENLKKQFVQKIAQKLNLNEYALLQLALKRPRPFALIPSNILVFRTPFQSSDVNSFLLVDEDSKDAAAFDTGTDATQMLQVIKARGLTLKYLFLTHAHGDHILEMDRIVEKTGAEAWIGEGESEVGAKKFAPGTVFPLGAVHVHTRLTNGHTSGGISYVLEDIHPAIAFVGDALFASSMGGASGTYRETLQTNLEQIYSLPNDSIVFPGHGPITTVGLEKKYNPFYFEK